MNNSTRADVNGLSIASLILGIITSPLSVLIIPTPFTATLSICFALLSRGDRNMNPLSLAGLILSIIGIVISIAVLVFLFAMIVSLVLAVIAMF